MEMKVNIGPYRNWFGPYQLVNFLRFLGFTDAFVDRIADSLPLGPFEALDGLRKRRIRVRIDRHDTWSMDHTLALIIHPMLLQLKARKHGSPFVEDADVPENVRSTAANPKENEWDTDEFYHDRWNWVMDEMIFAFKSVIDDNWEDKYFNEHKMFDQEGYTKEAARIANGFVLFGKYYQGLWD